MPYAAQTDLETRFGSDELIQLTDPAGVAIDATVVDAALADADAVIDGYLAGRYTLPLATTPPILVGYACDIARARLWKDSASDLVLQREKDAITFLQMVGQGKVTLGVQPPETGDSMVEIVPADRQRYGTGL